MESYIPLNTVRAQSQINYDVIHLVGAWPGCLVASFVVCTDSLKSVSRGLGHRSQPRTQNTEQCMSHDGSKGTEVKEGVTRACGTERRGPCGGDPSLNHGRRDGAGPAAARGTPLMNKPITTEHLAQNEFFRCKGIAWKTAWKAQNGKLVLFITQWLIRLRIWSSS